MLQRYTIIYFFPKLYGTNLLQTFGTARGRAGGFNDSYPVSLFLVESFNDFDESEELFFGSRQIFCRTGKVVAYRQDIPVAVISEALGHDSERTTRIYLASIGTERVDYANSMIISLLK